MPEQRVSQVQVLSETLNLVGSAKHPVFQRDSIRFRELENLPIVMPSLQSGLHAILSRRASAAGLRLAPFMECASSDLAMQMLHEEEMYCLMPERVYREEMAEGRIAAIPIIEPELTMPVFWAVKPDWRLPRALYNELERVVFEEWYDAVASGVWPAEWIFDLNALSLPFRPRLATPDDPRS
jgi:LysR family nitrogen assimilation transcriptional regulator